MNMAEQDLGGLFGLGNRVTFLALHSLCVGFWLLYCLKTASLFVRRSTAWAITGIIFVYCPGFNGGTEELVMVLQTISLYHILVWARGKKDHFHPRHFFILGLGISVAWLSNARHLLFWAPIFPLMLWVNKNKRTQGILLTLAGSGAVILISAILNYSQTISAFCGNGLNAKACTNMAESIILTRPMQLFSDVMPTYAQGWIPALVALFLGHVVLFMWMRPFRKIHPGRKRAINGVLLLSFALGMWAYFGMAPEWAQQASGTGAPLCYFLPFILISLIGCSLNARRMIRNRSAKRVLRGIGLMLPFVTLVVLLIIPVFRKAFGTEQPQPAPTIQQGSVPAAAQDTP